ncbi:MAG: ATP-binding protein [Pseudomonadota bacterium]
MVKDHQQSAYVRASTLLGVLSTLLLLSTVFRHFTAVGDPWVTRLLAAFVLGGVAVFVRLSKIAPKPLNQWLLLAVLPFMSHTATTTFQSNLSHDMVTLNVVFLLFAGLLFESRRWLVIILTCFVATLLAVAYAVPEPQMSPSTFTLLMTATAVLVYVVAGGFNSLRHELVVARQHLEEAQQFAGVGTWEFDKRTNRTSWSNRAKELLELDGDSTTKTLLDLVADDPDSRTLAQSIERFLHSNSNYEGRGEVQTNSGKRLWIQTRGKTLGSDPSTQKKYGVFLDLSEDRAKQEQLADALAEAESAASARTRFLANMSHEIRTPLNGVLGMTSLLEREPLHDRAREAVKTIQSCGESLLATINDILDFSKLDAGAVELEARPFLVDDLLKQSTAAVKQAIESKGLALVVTHQGEGKALVGDHMRLRQVLTNLLSNAAKFTKHGEVRLVARTTPKAESDAELTIEVADSGIGMSEPALKQLFTPFSQADASTTRRFGGTGLGLSICKHIIDAMGGTIGVESAEGEGTTFTITVCLPSTEIPVTELHRERSSELIDSLSLRVLVAEDNPVNQRVARRMLESLECTVDVVEDGEAAVRAAKETRYDVILMDIHMPKLDGLGATQQIRQFADAKSLPIYALTADVVEHSVAAYEAAGLSGVQAKPLRLEDLHRLLSGLADLDHRSVAS